MPSTEIKEGHAEPQRTRRRKTGGLARHRSRGFVGSADGLSQEYEAQGNQGTHHDDLQVRHSPAARLAIGDVVIVP